MSFLLPTGHEHQYEWVKQTIFMVFALSVIDGIMTIYWVSSHQAVEANPLMAGLLAYHPLAFMLGKLALVMPGSAVLWRTRRRSLTIIATFLLFLVYYAILIYHLRSWLLS